MLRKSHRASRPGRGRRIGDELDRQSPSRSSTGWISSRKPLERIDEPPAPRRGSGATSSPKPARTCACSSTHSTTVSSGARTGSNSRRSTSFSVSRPSSRPHRPRVHVMVAERLRDPIEQVLLGDRAVEVDEDRGDHDTARIDIRKWKMCARPSRSPASRLNRSSSTARRRSIVWATPRRRGRRGGCRARRLPRGLHPRLPLVQLGEVPRRLGRRAREKRLSPSWRANRWRCPGRRPTGLARSPVSTASGSSSA